MTVLGYASGESYGRLTLSVVPVPPGTGYSDAVAEAQRRGARLVCCDSLINAASDNSGTLLSDEVLVKLQGVVGELGVDCSPAKESDFPG